MTDAAQIAKLIRADIKTAIKDGHGGICPACGARTTCTRHAGSRGGSRQTPAQKSAARTNLRKGGHPIEYTCPCGAQGREISRWRTVDGGTIKTKCRKCGRRGERKG